MASQRTKLIFLFNFFKKIYGVLLRDKKSSYMGKCIKFLGVGFSKTPLNKWVRKAFFEKNSKVNEDL